MSESIQVKPGKYEDVMPDMSDEEYARLKADIKKNGLKYPILVNDDGEITDGHHRFRACEELGIEPWVEKDEEGSIESAIRSNLIRRNHNEGVVREVVENYLEDHYQGERTQEEIANELGVSQSLVSTAWKAISPDNFTRDEKRQMVKGYIEEHPDASNRKVARNVEADVTHPTVGEWREEWKEEAEEEAEEEDEHELAAQIVAANYDDPYANDHQLAREVGCKPKQVEGVRGRLRLDKLDQSIIDRAKELSDETSEEESDEDTQASESESETESGADKKSAEASDGQDEGETDSDNEEEGEIACPVCKQDVLLLNPDGTPHACDAADNREATDT